MGETSVGSRGATAAPPPRTATSTFARHRRISHSPNRVSRAQRARVVLRNQGIQIGPRREPPDAFAWMPRSSGRALRGPGCAGAGSGGSSWAGPGGACSASTPHRSGEHGVNRQALTFCTDDGLRSAVRIDRHRRRASHRRAGPRALGARRAHAERGCRLSGSWSPPRAWREQSRRLPPGGSGWLVAALARSGRRRGPVGYKVGLPNRRRSASERSKRASREGLIAPRPLPSSDVCVGSTGDRLKTYWPLCGSYEDSNRPRSRVTRCAPSGARLRHLASRRADGTKSGVTTADARPASQRIWLSPGAWSVAHPAQWSAAIWPMSWDTGRR
jgi:hypothetical protein